MIQNTTIEERVTILESQVVEIEEDVIGLNIGLAEVDQIVDFLFDEQVIQDERLFSLEQTSLGILGELDSVEDELESAYVIYQDFSLNRPLSSWIRLLRKNKCQISYLLQIYRTQLLL